MLVTVPKDPLAMWNDECRDAEKKVGKCRKPEDLIVDKISIRNSDRAKISVITPTGVGHCLAANSCQTLSSISNFKKKKTVSNLFKTFLIWDICNWQSLGLLWDSSYNHHHMTTKEYFDIWNPSRGVNMRTGVCHSRFTVRKPGCCWNIVMLTTPPQYKVSNVDNTFTARCKVYKV